WWPHPKPNPRERAQTIKKVTHGFAFWFFAGAFLFLLCALSRNFSHPRLGQFKKKFNYIIRSHHLTWGQKFFKRECYESVTYKKLTLAPKIAPGIYPWAPDD
ncbi:hypothetical protein ACVGWU_00105, partial [Enterobacter intestinihominis]